MMKTIKNPDNNELFVVDESEVGQFPYEGWPVVADGGPTGENQIIVSGQWVTDLATVKARAKEKVLADAIEAAASLVPELRHQVSIFLMWYEVQRLKLAMATNQVSPDTEERRRQYPMIMALSFLSGATPQQVVTAIETRYWDRIKNMALFEARMILGRDAVDQASTESAAVQAAENIDWTPNAP